MVHSSASLPAAKSGGDAMSGVLEFGRPELFWLLALLPLLWIRYRSQPVIAILWRCVVLVLVIAALADPRSVKPLPAAKGGERVFAFDVSRSVPAETRRWMARQERIPASGDRVFIFAGAPEETRDWKRRLEAPGQDVKPERTNIEALFSALLKLPREERSVFLFTDGWENDGSAERLLPALAEAGIRVYPVLPPDRPAVPNVAVKKVVAPAEIGRSQALNLKIAVENGNRREVDGAIVLKRGGRPIKTETVKLRSGSQLLNYQVAVGEEPLQSFEAEFTPRESGVDAVPSDNRATAWVAIQAKEKALVVNGRSGEGRYVEELLRRRGFEVTSAGASGSLPAATEYGIVVLNNVDKDRLPSSYFSALERYATAGGGLVMLGDSTALTPAYRQTPIAAALPIEFSETKEKQKEPEKARAVLLVIDKSSSMDPNINPYKENRILYAKEIAKRVISQLADNDFIGVIGFDTAPFPIVQIDTVQRLRQSFAREIDRLVPKGNTEIVPALREAMNQLQRQKADSKFVILITDADHVGGRPSEYTDVVTRMRNEQNIVVSAVGIGRGVDEALVKRIGSYGGGKSHIARNMNDFPTFEFERGPKTPPAPPKTQAQDFKPIVAERSEILAALESQPFPVVRGYVESELKRGARLDLMVQNEGKNHPLLASWNYGKGKVAVLTIDQSGRWSRDWIGWSGLERFWGRVFDWLKPQPEALPPHEARINQSSDQTVLDFYLYSADFDGDAFRYGYTGPKGVRGDGMLKHVAPGHYQAALPLGAAGDYRIELKEERRSRTLNYPPLGYTRQTETKAELPTADLNLALLERIAQSTGGTINPDREPQIQQNKLAPQVTPLHAYLILAAALLFLAERFIRTLLILAA
jgi:uncharacterized membrane protein